MTQKRIFTKYEGNPVVSPAMMPQTVLYTFNPGATTARPTPPSDWRLQSWTT